MESEEAIMENENNSNVESESNRDGDLKQPDDDHSSTLTSENDHESTAFKSISLVSGSNMHNDINRRASETSEAATDVDGSSGQNEEQDTENIVAEKEVTGAFEASGIIGNVHNESDFILPDASVSETDASESEKFANQTVTKEQVGEDNSILHHIENACTEGEEQTTCQSEDSNLPDTVREEDRKNYSDTTDPPEKQDLASDKPQKFWDDDINLLGEDSQDHTDIHESKIAEAEVPVQNEDSILNSDDDERMQDNVSESNNDKELVGAKTTSCDDELAEKADIEDQSPFQTTEALKEGNSEEKCEEGDDLIENKESVQESAKDSAVVGSEEDILLYDEEELKQMSGQKENRELCDDHMTMGTSEEVMDISEEVNNPTEEAKNVGDSNIMAEPADIDPLDAVGATSVEDCSTSNTGVDNVMDVESGSDVLKNNNDSCSLEEAGQTTMDAVTSEKCGEAVLENEQSSSNEQSNDVKILPSQSDNSPSESRDSVSERKSETCSEVLDFAEDEGDVPANDNNSETLKTDNIHGGEEPVEKTNISDESVVEAAAGSMSEDAKFSDEITSESREATVGSTSENADDLTPENRETTVGSISENADELTQENRETTVGSISENADDIAPENNDTAVDSVSESTNASDDITSENRETTGGSISENANDIAPESTDAAVGSVSESADASDDITSPENRETTVGSISENADDIAHESTDAAVGSVTSPENRETTVGSISENADDIAPENMDTAVSSKSENADDIAPENMDTAVNSKSENADVTVDITSEDVEMADASVSENADGADDITPENVNSAVGSGSKNADVTGDITPENVEMAAGSASENANVAEDITKENDELQSSVSGESAQKGLDANTENSSTSLNSHEAQEGEKQIQSSHSSTDKSENLSKAASNISSLPEQTVANADVEMTEPSSADHSISQNDSDDDIMEVTEIKKELVSEPFSSENMHPKSESSLGKNIKNEPEIEAADGNTDGVVILDDEGEVVPMKKEAEDAKAAENGLGIQISAVSGQQHQLHASADQNLNAPDGTAKADDAKASKPTKSKFQTCIVCQKICKCKYNIVRNGDIKHLCDDACFRQFRKSPGVFLKNKDDAKPSKKLANDVQPIAAAKTDASAVRPILPNLPADTSVKQPNAYKTCTVCQLMDFNAQQIFCNWKGLDFCGESCLGKFQANLNTSCSFCHAYIPMDMRATFCLKIGNDMRPFCKQKCYSEFKKKLRLCAFCQRDIAAVPSAFTAMVGTDSKFKEFCSQTCLKKMESQVNDVEVLSVDRGSLLQETITCSVCEKTGAMKHTVKYQGKVSKLCSDLCLSAFQYTNKINMTKCDSCGTMCTAEEAQAHFLQYEGQVKRFCSDHCVSHFRKANSKGVSCKWCGTKKLNFDMIERLDSENKYQVFCSLNCLSLYRVNLQAKSNQAVACDQCRKVVPAQYHLTMSDASVRNFCTYTCVMTFQSQFVAKHSSPSLAQTLSTALPPAQLQLQQQPLPIPQQQQKVSKRGRANTRQASVKQQPQPQPPSFPVISNVMSLAPAVEQQASGVNVQTSPALEGLLNAQGGAAQQTGNRVTSGDGKHQILIQAPPPKLGKNKSLQCRPFTQTKATSCRPHSQSREIQTDEVPAKSVMVPIPVPIYIPMPTVMFSAPTPKLIPVPIPIPVPIFIPTTRKSANGISKVIKEIVERMPADPLEAELLMMAEAVAADKRPGDSDTDSEADAANEDFSTPDDDDMRPAPTPREEETFNMRKREGQGEEDMIQMALRMAEEMSGPIEDLETSVEPVAVSSEPPTQCQRQNLGSYETPVEDEYIPTKSARGRGAKRASRGRPSASRPKKQRIERPYSEEDSLQSNSAAPPQSMEPPPDVNYRLKFTYGVNAWRHWVISKNAHIEKTKQNSGSFRVRLFPTDILKCTTDELNFTLCMFIKEVRKPNGDEYSADSIYYLCLGIQQYLYENGRIDNIFTDVYFEKFTNSLHEILKALQPKVNTQGQMLCRIEEEHLWESKQLGAHSPFVLLNTLIYFHTKHFILKTAQEHMSLSFAQILKHWKKGMPVKGQAASCGKNVSLRFYCLANGKKDGLAARKNKEGVPVYEVTENFDNPLRCPVKLYEFFLSKCPESIKNRNDIFYPVPERSCVPDSPVWYSTQSIDIHTMDKMLTRVLLVREIQEAHLHAQPIYL